MGSRSWELTIMDGLSSRYLEIFADIAIFRGSSGLGCISFIVIFSNDVTDGERHKRRWNYAVHDLSVR